MHSKYKILIIAFLFLPIAVYLDYVYIGVHSVSGYIVTCVLEIILFFIGVNLGEHFEREKKAKT